MTDLGWIVIPRWDEFQHRDMARSTVPPWIKTYTKLMADDAYLNLTFRQRGILHGIWLEYARARRVLGASPARLGLRLGDESVRRRDLEALNHAGFISISASKPAGAHASKVAGLEVEVEKKVLRASPENVKPRIPYSAPPPPTPGRVNGPPTNVEAHVRGLVANGVITEAFELDDYDLDPAVRDELAEHM
jgi:hypothetical protein